ncbi:MAG: DUF6494 family protein [Pseudomonadota bacterium]
MADPFNMSVRKFLKQVGITSQQEIEAAVRAAQAAGTLPDGPLAAKVTLSIPGIDLNHEVQGSIQTGDD